jgi:DNA (cytosine-5)-methyltransferase 1
VGGLSLGVSAAFSDLSVGNKVMAAVDIDSRALEVFDYNFRPSQTIHGSVSDIVSYHVVHKDSGWHFHEDPELTCDRVSKLAGSIDLVVGGPPCQGHSNLNNKTRGKDPKNSLYLSAVAAAVGLGAKAIILENVPEVTRSMIGVINIARDLLFSRGYQVSDGTVSAHDIGWVQRRRRHFLVASKEVLLSPLDCASANSGKGPSAAEFLAMLPPMEFDDVLDGSPEFASETKARLEYFGTHPREYDLPLDHRPACHRQGTTYGSVYGRMRPDEPVPTITTGFLTPGRGRFIHPTELRTLTPREAALAQGFPVWFDFHAGKKATRSELSKWIGDAVPLPLGYVAAQAVLGGLIGNY